MDKDDRKLIVRRCTRAGMMMEDASAVAIGTAGLGPEALAEAVNELAIVAVDVERVISAAVTLAKSSTR